MVLKCAQGHFQPSATQHAGTSSIDSTSDLWSLAQQNPTKTVVQPRSIHVHYLSWRKFDATWCKNIKNHSDFCPSVQLGDMKQLFWCLARTSKSRIWFLKAPKWSGLEYQTSLWSHGFLCDSHVVNQARTLESPQITWTSTSLPEAFA